jgi:translation elongation factor EF-Tu-like GTPase
VPGRPHAQTREHVLWRTSYGTYMSSPEQVDLMEDEELLELVEVEFRKLLTNSNSMVISPVVRVSAAKALEVRLRHERMHVVRPHIQLMDALTAYPVRYAQG